MDEHYPMRLSIPREDIIHAAKEILQHEDEQTDAWLAEILAERYTSQPVEVTVGAYLKKVTQLARPACEEQRDLINGYGGPVPKRA